MAKRKGGEQNQVSSAYRSSDQRESGEVATGRIVAQPYEF